MGFILLILELFLFFSFFRNKMSIEIESFLEVILVCLPVLAKLNFDFFSINFLFVIILTLFGQTTSAQQKLNRHNNFSFRKISDVGITHMLIIPFFMNNADLGSSYLSKGTFTGLWTIGIYIYFGKYLSLVSTALLFSYLMFILNIESIAIVVLIAIVCASVFISLVKTIPNSFSFAETSWLSQSITLLLMVYFGRIYDLHIKGSLNVYHGNLFPTFVLITIVSSILGVIFLIPVMYCKAYWSYSETDIIVASICFHICSILVILFIFFPSCFLMMGTNPIYFIWSTTTMNMFRQLLVGYWFILVLLSFGVVYWFSQGNTTIPKTIVRKMFHGLAFMIFIPLYKDIEFFTMVTVIMFDIFTRLEMIRINKISPFSKLLTSFLEPFREEQDSGPMILTHIYLLFGLSLPLWLTVGEKDFDKKFLNDPFYFLSVYCGVMSLCVGDTFASLVGTIYGKRKWPNRKKSYIGTVACFVSMFLFCVLLLITFHFTLNMYIILRLLFFTLYVSLLESVSCQVDNLILPFYSFLMCRFLAQ